MGRPSCPAVTPTHGSFGEEGEGGKVDREVKREACMFRLTHPSLRLSVPFLSHSSSSSSSLVCQPHTRQAAREGDFPKVRRAG